MSEDSPIKNPRMSRIPVSPPKGEPPSDHKRRIPIRPPSEDSSPSNPRKMQIQNAREREENNTTTPIMAESPHNIKESPFANKDPEFAKLIKQQRQIQNENNCPFGDVDDDDDLVVPSCAKDALAARKLFGNDTIREYDPPPFLVEGDDDDDDLVIPTEALEYIKQKGMTIEDVRQSSAIQASQIAKKLTDSMSSTKTSDSRKQIDVSSDSSDSEDVSNAKKKKSVFAKLENFNYTEQSFQPFAKAQSAIANKYLPKAPKAPKIPKLDLEYSVYDDMEQDQNKVVQSMAPIDPLNLIENNDDKSDLKTKMLDIKLHDARINVDMVTKYWQQKIDEEMEDGRLRLQQLEAQHNLQSRRINPPIKTAEGAKIYRPSINTAPGGKRNSMEMKYQQDKELMIKMNKQNLTYLQEKMQRELERPKAKLAEIENEYKKLGLQIPPLIEHAPRQRFYTSRNAPKA